MDQQVNYNNELESDFCKWLKDCMERDRKNGKKIILIAEHRGFNLHCCNVNVNFADTLPRGWVEFIWLGDPWVIAFAIVQYCMDGYLAVPQWHRPESSFISRISSQNVIKICIFGIFEILSNSHWPSPSFNARFCVKHNILFLTMTRSMKQKLR